MLALVLTAALALSAPGTLDRDFGGDGRVVTPTPAVPAVAGVESVGGGKLLLAGTIGHRVVVLIRYRRDGSLDRRFGRRGLSAIRFDRDVTATDTLLDSRGRLLVAGSLGALESPGRAALLLRFDRAGHLDPALDHDGISVTSFGGESGDEATGVALTRGGEIVLAAEVHHAEGSGLGVTRLDPSGAVDGGFGDQGLVRRDPDFSFDHLSPSAVGVQSDGRVVVALTSWGPKGSLAEALHLLPDGAPDPAFDQYGFRILWFLDSGVDDLLVDHSTRRLLFAGGGPSPKNPDDFLPSVTAVDSSVSKPAWTTWFGKPTHQLAAHRLSLDAAGRALAAGTHSWEVPSPDGRLAGQLQRSDMVVWRLRTGGKLDRCFGRRGMAGVHFPGKRSTTAAIAIGEHGSITIAGPPPHAYEHTPHRFELARLHGGSCRR